MVKKNKFNFFAGMFDFDLFATDAGSTKVVLPLVSLRPEGSGETCTGAGVCPPLCRAADFRPASFAGDFAQVCASVRSSLITPL